MKYVDVSGKTIELAVEEGLKELNTTLENIELTILKQPGMFSRAKVRLTLVEEKLEKVEVKEAPKAQETRQEPKQTKKVVEAAQEETKPEKAAPKSEVTTGEYKTVAGKVLDELVKNINSSLKVKEKTQGNVIILEVEGDDDLGALIGRQGSTLEALQTLMNSIQRIKQFENRKRIILHVGDSQKLREEKLNKLALKTIEECINQNKTIRMEPMNSFERRIAHTEIQKDARVVSESFGVDPYRYITVRPKGENE